MPVQRKGFLARHFEKVACAVVGVGLILSLLYVSHRASGAKAREENERILEVIARLERGERQPSQVPDPPDYVSLWHKALETVQPGEVSDKVNYIYPRTYEQVYMGTDKEHVLEFQEPLAPNSVRVENERPIGGVVAKIQHPVGMDYSQVKVWTRRAGTAWIVGMGDKAEQRQPVVVDPRAGARARPPKVVEVSSWLDGIEVSFEPNPDNQKDVVVEAYEIFRRGARDVGGEFQKVQMISVDRAELTEEGRELLGRVRAERDTARETERLGTGPLRSGVDELPSDRARDLPGYFFPGLIEFRSPGSPGYSRPGYEQPQARPTPRVRRDREAEEEKLVYRWVDNRRIVPGESYLYKVRTVAYLSQPKESEYTDEILAKAPHMRDFKFTGRYGNKLRFEVAVYDNGSLYRQQFYNAIGEEIGGTIREEGTGQVRNFLTNCYAMDYHRSVRMPEAHGYRDRIIYINRRGNVEGRRKGEAEVPQLFKARLSRTTARRPGAGTPGSGTTAWPGREDYVRPRWARQ